MSEHEITHPAQYSKELMPTIAVMATGYRKILDPMAGVGNIFELKYYMDYPTYDEICAVEIEPEWAAFDDRIIVGSVLDLPWPDGYFDCIVVSPPYGNRMADKLGKGKWAFTRHSYATGLRRELSDDNGAALQWGDKYRKFHAMAWKECYRVLRVGGRFILNIKDHYRGKELQPVTQWHVDELIALGFAVVRWEYIDTPGMRRGRNYELRVDSESVIALDKIK